MPKHFDFKYQSSSIVLIGELDALSFSPKVFELSKILSEEDTKASSVKVYAADVIVTTYPWFELSISPADKGTKKLVVNLTDLGYETQFVDLVNSLLNLHYPNTLSALGINYTRHIQHKSQKLWHAAGHSLITLERWKNAFSPQPDSHFGMRAIALKIEDVLPTLDAYPTERTPELNIDVHPVSLDHNKNSVKNYSELTFNYHFNLVNDESSSNHAENFINMYYFSLQNDLNCSIEQLLDNQ